MRFIGLISRDFIPSTKDECTCLFEEIWHLQQEIPRKINKMQGIRRTGNSFMNIYMIRDTVFALHRTELRDWANIYVYLRCSCVLSDSELFPFLAEFKEEEKPLGLQWWGFYVNRCLIGRRVPHTNPRCTHIYILFHLLKEKGKFMNRATEECSDCIYMSGNPRCKLGERSACC